MTVEVMPGFDFESNHEFKIHGAKRVPQRPRGVVAEPQPLQPIEFQPIEAIKVSKPALVSDLLSGIDVTTSALMHQAQTVGLEIAYSDHSEYAVIFRHKLSGRKTSQVLLDATPDQKIHGGHDVGDKHDWPDLYTGDGGFKRRLLSHTGTNDMSRLNTESQIQPDMEPEQVDLEEKWSGIRTFYYYYEQIKAVIDSDFNSSSGKFKATENTEAYLVAVARWQVDANGNRKWQIHPDYKTDALMQLISGSADSLFTDTSVISPQQFDLAVGIFAFASLQRKIIDRWPKRESLGGESTRESGSTQAPGLLLGRRDLFLDPQICTRFEELARVGEVVSGTLQFTTLAAPELILPANFPVEIGSVINKNNQKILNVKPSTEKNNPFHETFLKTDKGETFYGEISQDLKKNTPPFIINPNPDFE